MPPRNIHVPTRLHAISPQVLARVRKTRVETYLPPASLGVAELRRRLGSKASGCLERSELVRALEEHLDCCCICSEAYVADDVYRVLPRCGHCFHIECIDRWAMMKGNEGTFPKCPLCNTEL